MNNPNLIPVYAEIFLLVAASAILLIDMFLSESKRSLTYWLALATLLGCGVLTFGDFSGGATVYTFSNMFVSDPMSNLLKLCSYVAVGLTIIYSRQYATERGMLSGNLGGEFYVLALFTLLGQMVMISGNNFLVIYLGLELMSLSLYALVALRRDNAVATEAAIVSGDAPGRFAETWIVGKSTLGRSEIGRSRYAMIPKSRIPSITSVVATGRRMKISEMLTSAPPLRA